MIILTRLQVHHFKSLQSIDLAFPRQGSILVEGLNEAGKSTLFEAVYCALYGEPLVGEDSGNRGRASYDGAICYHATEAQVRLELDVAGTLVMVERTLRTKGTNRARLTVTRPGEGVEEVSGMRAVNERLLQELGNLDKEALLNSCFVEQKKLSKLEDLGFADRRRSLEHLLNLDKLQRLHEDFRLTRQDDSLLETLRLRADLAQAQTQVPQLEASLTDLGERLILVTIHEALAQMAMHTTTRQDLDRQQVMLGTERDLIQTVQRRIGTLKGIQPALAVVSGFRTEVTQGTTRLDGSTAALAALDRQEQTELPGLRDRQARIETLDALLGAQQRRAGDLQRTQQEIVARQADLDAVAHHADLARQLTEKIAGTQVRIEAQRAALVTDEAAAETEKATLTVRQTIVQGVVAHFEPLREAEHIRQQAAQAVTWAATQVAEHAGLLERQRTTEDDVQAGEAAVGQATTAYKQAQVAADEIHALLTTQQMREHAHQTAIAAVADAERELGRVQEEVTRAEQRYEAIQQALHTVQTRESAFHAATAAFDAATQARTEITDMLADQQQLEQAHIQAQVDAQEAAAGAAATAARRTALDAAAAAQATATTAVQAAETTYESAQQALTTARMTRALTAWLQARRTEEALRGVTAAGTAGEQAASAAQVQLAALTQAQTSVQRRLIGLLGAGAVLIGMGVALLVLNWSGLAAILLLVLGLVVVSMAVPSARARANYRQAVGAAQQELALARGQVAQVAAEQKAAEALGGGAARLAEAEAELRALNVSLPEDVAAAETRLTAAVVSGDLRTAEAEVTVCREALDAARARLNESTLAYSLLKSQALPTASAIDPAELAARVAMLAADVQSGRVALAVRAQALLPPDLVTPTDWAQPDQDALQRAALDTLVDTRYKAQQAARQAQTAAQAAQEVLAGQLPPPATAGVTMPLLEQVAALRSATHDRRDQVAATVRVATEHATELGSAVQAGRAELVAVVQTFAASGVLATLEAVDTWTDPSQDARHLTAVPGTVEHRRTARDEAMQAWNAAQIRSEELQRQIAAHPVSQGGIDEARCRATLQAHEQQVQQIQDTIAAGAALCRIDPQPAAMQAVLQTLQVELAAQTAILAAIPAHREQIAVQEQQVVADQQALAQEQAWLAERDQPALTARHAELIALAGAAAQEMREQTAVATQQAADLGLASDRGAVQQALGATVHQVTRLQEHLSTERPRLQTQAAVVQQAIAAANAAGAVAWQALLPLPEAIPTAHADLPPADTLQTVTATVQKHLEALDEPSVLARLTALDRQAGDLAAQVRQTQENIAGQAATIQRFLERLAVSAAPTAGAIAAACPAFTEVGAADRARLEEALDEQRAALHATRDQIADLAERLDLPPGEALDRTQCVQERTACDQDMEVRKQAVRIVQAVRERMIQQVLPHTARNMRLLIPLLTLDRYRDCRITDDYKLEIWDEAAGRYVAKSIFSGGTRDQFSLALRLAFALATLPQELGTTPGFIFLDEPLSAFDGPRTEALITLLTQGAIHANFDQIFVISHNRMFDRQAFTHHIRMEGGRVADHDLPRLASAGR